MKEKSNLIVKHEEQAKYYTANDHLFILTGPSGAGKKEIAAILEIQGVARYEKRAVNIKNGFIGIAVIVDSPPVIEVLRHIIPESHMTVIYINAPDDKRYSRLAYYEQKQPAEIRQINRFDDGVYRSCRADWIINSQDLLLEEVAEIVRQVIEETICNRFRGH